MFCINKNCVASPFRPGIPVQVPLWMAINLKQRQKCRLSAPEWMNVETLTQLKEDEAQSRAFTCMPDEHYMVTTQLILGAAPHDVANSDEIRTLVKVCEAQGTNYSTSGDFIRTFPLFRTFGICALPN